MSEKIAAPSTVTVTGGVIVREFRISAGSNLVTHKHPYDHLSMLLSGQVILSANGQDFPMTGPCSVEIKAGIEHGVYAVTDCVWDCVHALNVAEESGDPFILDGVAEELN